MRQRAEANLTAIRTLKALEREGRSPVAEERVALARYSSFGALPRLFEQDPGEWSRTAKELRVLLTEDEWVSVRRSTPNAHYTSRMVIQAIWAGVRRLGVPDDAHVLEPALGVGHFFGFQPTEMHGPRTGFELELVSGRIAQLLYPASAVRVGAFEAQRRLGGYDLVVSNVPFGNYPVVDGNYRESTPLRRAVHDYFIGRSLEEVRPGGIVAVVTSRYTMDKVRPGFREWLAERGRLLGAVRLPRKAFLGSAGTEVVTDILFLQRYGLGVERGSDGGAGWAGVSLMSCGGQTARVNEYFIDHPGQVLGEFGVRSAQHGYELVVEGELEAGALHRALEVLPESVVPEGTGNVRSWAGWNPAALSTAADKEGSFVVQAGRLVVVRGGEFAPAGERGRRAERIAGMVRVRDAALALIKLQLEDGATEAGLAGLRQRLTWAYDGFVGQHGPLRSAANVMAFAEDPDAGVLLSLEDTYDPSADRATKALIFTRRTVEPYRAPESAETAAAALSIALAETGRVDWGRMVQLLDKEAGAVAAELGELVFEDPAGGQWVTREEYLSGNVRAKLERAESAALVDTSFERNVRALQAVLPRDLTPGDIKVGLGAAWIPCEDVQAFAGQLMGGVGKVRVERAVELASWVVVGDWQATGGVANRHTWGTDRMTALKLLEDALNQRTPLVVDVDSDGRAIPNVAETIAAREKLKNIETEFGQWVWRDDERRDRLVHEYNRTFNAYRRRVYDGSHLQLPGMARGVLRDGDLAPHQKAAVWRQLQSRSTLLGLPVGAGKTYAMVAAAQEGRRLGFVRRAVFVVPGSLVEQWGAAYQTLYPSARVLVGTRADLAAGKRQEFMARSATGVHDAVIVAHSSFSRLPLRPETESALLRSEVRRLEAATEAARAIEGASEGRRSVVKELEKAKQRLESRIERLSARDRKDRSLCFEDLGFDALFVDEAHAYKNLSITTKMSRVAGLPSGESQRAWDMYAKTRVIRDAGGRVVFATATPVTNSLAEIFNMQRYLQEETLAELGIDHFDAWVASFAERRTELELSPDGSGFRQATRLSDFKNAPELSAMFSQVMELREERELGLQRPAVVGGRPELVVVDGTEQLREFVRTLGERAERIRSGAVAPAVDNMLLITSQGRRAALDLRELGMAPSAGATQKVDRIADEVARLWRATAATRSAQVVFCDLSTPQREGFSFYRVLREELISRGLPPGEIRFIHEAETEAEKRDLFAAVNAGVVRVVVGSTEKLGTGVNMQERLVAAHHADAPWRPADLEQRNGRVVRPGNTHSEVYIKYYVTEGSFDGFSWQGLQRKQVMVDQMMRGEVLERTIEDVGASAALTAAEAKALAAGNPEIMEAVRLETEIRRLAVLQRHHQEHEQRVRWEVSMAESSAGALEQLAGHYDLDAALVRSSASAGLTIGDVLCSGEGVRRRGALALEAELRKLESRVRASGAHSATVGSCCGLRLVASGRQVLDGSGRPAVALELSLGGRERYIVALERDRLDGSVASIAALAHAGHIEGLARKARTDAGGMRSRIAELRCELGKSFAQAERLAELRARYAEITTRLSRQDERQAASVALPEREEPGSDVDRLEPGDELER